MPALVHSLALVAVLTPLLTAACATTEVRATRPEEQARVAEAFMPLLRAAYGAESAGCRVATGVLEADNFEVWIRAAPDAPCELRVVLTTRAVGALTPRALQMLLAHELGHVQSRHAMGRERQNEIRGSRTDGGHRTVLRTSEQQFTPDEEAGADAAAARLLTIAWPGSNVGCLGLADFYGDVARDRRPWGPWLSRHPFPERRVGAVVRACESEQRRK